MAKLVRKRRCALLAGIYYDPVDKLTIGLEAGWMDPQGGNNDVDDTLTLVTVYKLLI